MRCVKEFWVEVFRFVEREFWYHLSALAFDALQLAPLLDRLGQIDLAQRHLHLADLVVLRETVEIEDRKHERLVHRLGVRHVLQRKTTITTPKHRSAAQKPPKIPQKSILTFVRPWTSQYQKWRYVQELFRSVIRFFPIWPSFDLDVYLSEIVN